MWRLFRSVNWLKTLYLNFKMLPPEVARRLPIFVYGRVTLSSLSGRIVIDAPIRPAMIGLGQKYEVFRTSSGTAELHVEGTIAFKGYAQFGPDYFIYVGSEAILEIGNMSSLGKGSKLICMHHVVFGDYVRIGYESQVIDTIFHGMIDLTTHLPMPPHGSISLGTRTYVGHRSSILKGAVTPDYCTIASNSVCNKDFSSLPAHTLLGGIPARLIRTNIVRDWDGENLDFLFVFNH
jgi:acetyltransferase-like isoleucine patch superfamily enzyme